MSITRVTGAFEPVMPEGDFTHVAVVQYFSTPEGLPAEIYDANTRDEGFAFAKKIGGETNVITGKELAALVGPGHRLYPVGTQFSKTFIFIGYTL